MIDRIANWVGLFVLVSAVAFAGYQYKEVHLPEFEVLKNTVEYHQCIQQCRNTCKANAVPLDKCNCMHCNVFKAY